MSPALRPEVIAPTYRHYTSLVAASAAGIVAALGVIALESGPARNLPHLAIAAPPLVIEDGVAVPVAAAAASPEVPATELLFVFHVGGETYVRLGDVEAGPDGTQALPRHRPPQLVDDDTGTAAVARVAPADLPAEYLGYRGKPLRVDASCVANVTGFAIVSRLVGDPAYAGEPGEQWTARGLMRAGATMLAARIDGCADGVYARDAAAPEIVALAEVEDAELEDAARAQLIASEHGRTTQERWREAGGEGTWHEHVELPATVYRHPITEAVWVVVHASHFEGCGGPTANLTGVFREAADGSLEEIRIGEDGPSPITNVVDVDGDGTPELIGLDWLGLEPILATARGEELDRLPRPFFGCPC